MKTPGEIKKGLERCSSETMFCAPEDPRCSYDCDDVVCIYDLMRDALAYIQQLEAERDAAVQAIFNIVPECYLCDYCKHSHPIDICPYVEQCQNYAKWQWRGVQKEE